MSNGWMTFWYVVGGVAAGLEARGQAARERAGGDLVLVAEVPDADLLAGEPARVVDAGVLPGDRQGAGALEDLGDVDEVGALLAGLEDLRAPSEIVNSGPFGCEPTACGDDVGPPGSISTVRFSAA